ncbi:MAG TPA: DUF6036 family nucleotidyltransferase [Myxococcaceae bacterium]|nr:DUF6036 family nucleotidyltransferase [Myxococcaceae bacterium]
MVASLAMRGETRAEKIRALMNALSRAAKGPGAIYFTGGASAVLEGWRESTIDVDLKLDPEAPGIFEALPRLKDELDLNVELASPDDFIPALPDWKSRSPLIAAQGPLRFYHYDFFAQALSKIERGHSQDVLDVDEMFRRHLVNSAELRSLFERIRPGLNRFPAIDEDDFANKVAEALKSHEGG